MAPGDVPPVGPHHILLEKQVVHAVVIHRRVGLVHPVLVGAAVKLGLIDVFGKNILQADVLVGDLRCLEGCLCHDCFFVESFTIQLQLVHVSAEHLVASGGNGFTVGVFAYQQFFLLSGNNGDTRINRPFACQFSVEIQRHVSGFPVKYGGHMVPLILMKILAVRPERQPLLSGPYLKA